MEDLFTTHRIYAHKYLVFRYHPFFIQMLANSVSFFFSFIFFLYQCLRPPVSGEVFAPFFSFLFFNEYHKKFKNFPSSSKTGYLLA